MSFVEQEDIFKVVEELMVNLLRIFQKKILSEKFPRIPYFETLTKLVEQTNQI